MAVLKDLIVHGSSRFLNASYFNQLKADRVGAEEGAFNKLIATNADIGTLDVEDLTAQNATVVGLLDVQGEMHTNSWTNANIANIGGSFYIAPTIIPTDGTTTISITKNSATGWTIALSGTFATDFIKTGTNTAGQNWPANSLVLVTGNIVVKDMKYPLGTLKGTLSAAVTASAASTSKTVTITGVTDGQGNTTPAVLDELWNLNGANISNAAFSDGKISLYKMGSYPIGIQMSSMGTNANSMIEIYGGVQTSPTVRIGHLAGLPTINGSAPTGWGIYTDNGYFSGVIVSNSGKIGNFTINSALYSNNHSAWNTDSNGIYINDNGIAGGPGGKWWFWQDGSAKIGAMTLSAAGVLTVPAANVSGALTAATIDASKITAGNIAAARMQTNLITAMDAVISDLQAINATIGGFAIDSTSIHTSGVAVTSNADNSVALSSADFTRTINDISREGLRFAIGDKFGVTGDGTIYASEAVISGAITASSGYIGNGSSGFEIGATFFRNGMTSLTDTTNNGIYVGTNGIALGAGNFKVTSGGALTTSNLQITSGNSYLAGDSTNINAFYWGTPTNFNVSYKGKYFINTSGNACFNSLYIGGHTVGNNWVTPTYYFNSDGNIKSNEATITGGIYLHSNRDRGIFVNSSGYVSVYNNENRVQLSAGSGSNTYRIYAYCSSFYVNSTLVSSSDKKIKNHISYLANDEKIEDFIMSLKPVSYTLKNGQSGRKHLGFYAQDVRDGAKKTIGDVGVYLASTLDMDDFENYNDDIPDEEISWGLRYDEFIAPLVALVQKQNREIKDLQNRIAYLEKSNDL